MEGSEQPVSEGVKTQLDRLSAQIDGLQQRLDAFMARRNETIADRASERVASIVAAAEKSAAEIKAAAESDAADLRKQASAEIHEVCYRLSGELQRGAEAALERITGRRPPPIPTAAATVSDRLREPAVNVSGRLRANQIAHEVKEAVGELENAAKVLEHSLRNRRAGADEPQRVGAA